MFKSKSNNSILAYINTVISIISDIFVKILSFLGTIAFATIVLVGFTQIIFRYVLRSPLIWPEELIVFLFIWITALGIPILAYKESFLKVDEHIEKLADNKKMYYLIKLLVVTSLLVISVLVFNTSIKFFQRQLLFGQVWGAALGIKSAYYSFSLVISFGLATFIFVGKIIKYICLIKGDIQLKEG